jgi:hypothetical protein
MVNDSSTFDKQSIFNSDKSIGEPNSLFKYSIFRENKSKEKPKAKARGTSIDSGNLILHVTNIQSKEVKAFIESLVSYGEISNINVAIKILREKTKIKKNNKNQYLIYFTVPSSYRFKYFSTPSINIYNRGQFPKNFYWYNKDRSFNLISKSVSALGLGIKSLEALETLILDSQEK